MAGELGIWGKVENIGTVQPREENTQEDLIIAFQYLKSCYRGGDTPCIWMHRPSNNGHKLL